ncbi:glycosyltransferase [Frondihabitans sp. PAMC 28766]|uniref:nucleotide disphospho-sugar-binding domain-containing protein n=1 Tax=Frondihabitans sp. PAMC 28766 TaxID=1795630 RepID=UPI00078DA6FF|nr:glycosyltransferase [Frondihabitans sp. PAMC 28766]AMM22374.1 glycosyltransferase [Frondihabitans sp. PAMC 28766]
MTLLIISPDYASHLLPLATFGTAWRDRGERVVVATGPATAAIVESFGFERVELSLARGSNGGVIRADDQPEGEDDSLRGFFDATREGMVETLAYQARERLTDLMWQPVETARRVLEVVEAVRPDQIMVDHLAFSARLALTAGRVPHADVVLGHPSALPVAGELYGFPPAWPEAFTSDPAALASLRDLCDRVSASFTAEWNAALLSLDPGAEPSASAFEEHGDLLLYNYPGELAASDRELPPHAFVGSAARDEVQDPDVEAWLASPEPFVYVSFGSFLSVRSDVLGRVAAALTSLLRSRPGLRAAIALGSASLDELTAAVGGPLPSSWLVREFLPQVRLLRDAAAAVTHGGNNSVTEAMTFGVPLVVLPFSTDQFAGAAAIEAAGSGVVLPPNTATVDEVSAALAWALSLRDSGSSAAVRLAALADSLQAVPGRERAWAALAEPAVPPARIG